MSSSVHHGSVGDADIVAEDRNQQPILIVEVKAMRVGRDAGRQLEELMRQAGKDVPYGMLVDRSSIQVYGWKRGAPRRMLELETDSILGAYDADLKNKRVFEPYLTTLVEAWLRDLAYHWKHKAPPGTAELRHLDLLDRLSGGDTRREVRLGGNSIRRN